LHVNKAFLKGSLYFLSISKINAVPQKSPVFCLKTILKILSSDLSKNFSISDKLEYSACPIGIFSLLKK
jgi:hypothetical protein